MTDYSREIASILRDAERRLRDLVAEAAMTTVPFPVLPGSLSRLVEVDPPPIHPRDRGLIAVGPDGDLVEFDMAFDPSGTAKDSVKPADLPPVSTIAFLVAAIDALTTTPSDREPSTRSPG